MSRIETLTDAQIARFAEFRDKWIAIGLSTEPANRERAEAAIAAAYSAANLPPPKKIVWCGSPMGNGLTREIIRANIQDSVGASVWDSVQASVWDSVQASVRDSVRASVWDSVGASVWASVRASVQASVGDSVWASVQTSVGASVWASVQTSVGASVRASGYGQHDASWLSYYDYFRHVCGLREQTERLCGLTDYAQAAGWFLPHTNICWVAERHNVLRRDERGRLHAADGPAVQYPDGWSIYAWHGVRVPEQVITAPATLTTKQISTEPNAEVRRVMVERFGQERYLRESGAKRISADELGELFVAEMKGDEPLVMVKVLNSTPEPDGSFKPYFIRVPPDMRSARDAVAWTFGFHNADEYASALVQQT